MDKLVPLFLILVVATPSLYCARILAMLPIGAKSHHRFTQSVVMALARAGHEVVLYTPFPHLLEHHAANLTTVYLENISLVDQSADMAQMIEEVTNYPFWKCLDLHWNFIDGFYPEFVNDKKIRELLTSNEKFDLLISETYSAQEFVLLLSKKFKVPVVGLHPSPSNNIVNRELGNSLSLSYIPDTCNGVSNEMSFVERMSNSFASLRGLYYHYNYYVPKLEKMMREDFPDAPPLDELTKSVSLMFVNDHLTADYTQPRPPNIIPVAGIHIQPPQSLPQDIQRFMDEATNGVILFSLGTYVPDDLKPPEYFEMYNHVFKKLKQRVLWKTKKENIPGLPKNVMTMKWAPQRDILAHPNFVLFITHGGQLSRVEALNFGVPVISIPQFFDQHKNSEFYDHEGVGIRLAIKDVSEHTMSAAIHKVLSTPSYRENMKKLSAIFRDRPMSPAESVVYWTEYVMRHGGAAHLRPASTRLHWYQLVLLDVLTAAVLVIFLSILTFCFVSKTIIKTYMSREYSSTKKKN